MTPENFVYWLQGFVELNDNKPLTEEQWGSIKRHLELVFTKSPTTWPKQPAIPENPWPNKPPLWWPYNTEDYKVIC